ncbi:AMP-binding protein [Microlunatus speluncae]|uniref:AMP-binding protein n=1 Tax=Microlunatus speluncae TaxID=2594267 RepID=UPI0012667DAC|nr:AMP-binding protein [Microlunatus speluncae]
MTEPTVATLTPALAAALAGGEPVAPLPLDPAERRAAMEMLRPAEPLEADDTAVVISTSGSTGRPKGVLLSAAALVASAEATHARLGGPGRWTLALPGHYVAGLMVIVRGLVADLPVREVRGDLADLSRPTGPGPHYLALVPAQLARALHAPDRARALAGYDTVLLGGAPAAPALLNSAATAGVRVVRTYGMSETCGGCVYDGEPLPGVSIKLRPDDHRISITGPMIFSGYRLRPELTAETLRIDGPDLTMITADRGAWADHRLTVLGRVDDVVITGGINVDLAELERLARATPTAADAELVIIGIPDSTWGTVIVAVADRPIGLDQLRADLAGTLPEQGLPRRLIHLPELPRTSSGKVNRQRLIEAAGNDQP